MSSRPTVDGEYDPMTAAANRAAAERRARQARERLRLQNEAAAAKKKAEAARIAQIKKKQAETAATAKRVRESAEKRAQAAAQRAEERAERKEAQAAAKKAQEIAKAKSLRHSAIPAKVLEAAVGAGARTGDPKPTPFETVMKTARARTETIIAPGVKVKEVVEPLLDGWAATNDKMHAKGNFLSTLEKAALLKEIQENPILGYNLMTGVKSEKPPKTLDEAWNRLGYTISEMTLGSTREYVLPFSLEAGEPRRVEDALLQTVGGLLILSPADLLVGNAVRALVGTGKKGSKILRKITKGIELTSDEALQFEKEIGQFGYSTSDLRKALGSKFGKLTQAEWDEFIVKYGKWYKFEQSYSAGAAYNPTLVEKFAELTDDMNYDIDEYIDYLKTYKLNPTMNPATLIAFINGVPPPKADLKAYDKVSSDLEKYRESQKQKLEEAQEEAVITGPVSRTVLKPKEPQKPGYTPPPEKEKTEEKEKTLPGFTPPPVKEKPDQPDPTKPGVTPKPDEEGEEDDDGGGGAVTPVLIQKEKTVQIQEQEEEEEDQEEDEKKETSLPLTPAMIKKNKKDPGSRPNVFHAMIGGIKEKYRVIFDYKKGPSETFTVTARSFPQALSQAQQNRRIKYVPSEVDVAKVGKKKTK